MKKFLSIFALVLALSALLCVSAMAEHPIDGTPEVDPYQGHDKDQNVTLANVESQSVTVDGETYTAYISREMDCGTGTPGIWRYPCVDSEKYGKIYYHELLIPVEHVWSHDVDGSKWGRVITEPTCTETGLAEDYCKVCGTTNTATSPRIIDAQEHRFVKNGEFMKEGIVVDKIPTCIENGKGHVECVICRAQYNPTAAEQAKFPYVITFEDYRDKILETAEEREAYDNGHQWDGWIIEKKPTCEKEGQKIRHCILCALKEEKKIDKLIPEYKVTKTRLVNCYVEYQTWACKYCNGRADSANTVDPSLDLVNPYKDGKHEFVLPRLVEAHQKGDKSPDSKAPTCTEDGFNIYLCKHAENDELVDPDDLFAKLVAAQPDETDPGLSGKKVKELHEDDTAAGFDFQGKIVRGTLKADAANANLKAYINLQTPSKSYCYEKVAALGHDWTAWTMVYEPGAGDNVMGHWYRECKRPGCTEVEEKIALVNPEAVCAPDAHKFVEDSRTEPTCAVEGEIVYSCKLCGTPKTEKIDKLPHTPVEDAAVAPTETTAGLTKGSHCAVCGEILVAQEEIPTVAKTAYEVEATGTKGTITPVENCVPLKRAYVRIVWNVTLANGDEVSFIANQPADIAEDGSANFKLGGFQAPAGSTVNWIYVEVVDDADADEKDTGSGYAAYGENFF